MRTALLLGLITAASAALSQTTIKPLPLPGLWEIESQMLINGQDLMANIRQTQEAMMKNMPPAQRQQMEATMRERGDAGGKTRECLTAKEVAELADPKKALARSMKEQPNCKPEVVSISGGTIKFKSRCDDPNGMTGDFTGEHTIVDTQHWNYSMQGRGQVPAQMPGAGPAAKGKNNMVDIKGSGQARWIAASCGEVKPRR